MNLRNLLKVTHVPKSYWRSQCVLEMNYRPMGLDCGMQVKLKGELEGWG